MNIRLTCIASGTALTYLSDACVALEAPLQKFFVDLDFGGGVSQFAIVGVAVGMQPYENDKFAIGYDKPGRYVHPISKLPVKYISFALKFDPDYLEKLDARLVRNLICDQTISRLADEGYKWPKGFDKDGFIHRLTDCLEILREVSSE